MGISIWHLLVVLAIALVVFGTGKIPNMMGDLGKGLRNFKKGIKGEDDDVSRITEVEAEVISKPKKKASSAQKRKK